MTRPGDHEGVRAESVVPDDLTGDGCQQLLQARIVEQGKRSGSRISDRVDMSSPAASIFESVMCGGGEPPAPMERGVLASQRGRRERHDRSAQPPQPLRHLRGEQAHAAGRHRRIGTESLIRWRGRYRQDERRRALGKQG